MLEQSKAKELKIEILSEEQFKKMTYSTLSTK